MLGRLLGYRLQPPNRREGGLQTGKAGPGERGNPGGSRETKELGYGENGSYRGSDARRAAAERRVSCEVWM